MDYMIYMAVFFYTLSCVTLGEAADLSEVTGCAVDLKSKVLTCSDTNLGDLEQYTLRCDEIKGLVFSNSGMSSMSSDFFSSCTQVTNLTILNESELNVIPSNSFSNLTKLMTIQVNDNPNLHTLGSSVFYCSGNNDLTTVSSIDLSRNAISKVGYPIGVRNIAGFKTSFNISHNQLTNFDALNSFGKPFNVFTSYDVSHNKLVDIGRALPSGLFDQASVTLDLSHNQLGDLSPLMGSLQLLCQTSSSCTLNLSYNQIYNVYGWIYEGLYKLYLDGNPMYELLTIPKRPRVKLVSLKDTKNLHYLPVEYLQTLDTSAVIYLGEDLSCCGIGKTNLGYYQGSTSTVQQQEIICVHNQQKFEFFATRLIAKLLSDPTWCKCRLGSCAPQSTCNRTSSDYALCLCDEPEKCYVQNGKPPIPGDSGTGDDSGGSFTSSAAFYVIIACVVVVILCCVGGFLFWRYMIKKRNKKSDHIYASGDEYYGGGGAVMFGRDIRGFKEGSEAFDQPPEMTLDGEKDNKDGHFFFEEFPGRLGPEPDNYLVADESGLYLGISGNMDKPPAIPDRNEEFTMGNIRKLSVADSRARVELLVNEAAHYEAEGNIYDPMYMEQKEIEKMSDEHSHAKLLTEREQVETTDSNTEGTGTSEGRSDSATEAGVDEGRIIPSSRSVNSKSK